MPLPKVDTLLVIAKRSKIDDFRLNMMFENDNDLIQMHRKLAFVQLHDIRFK